MSCAQLDASLIDFVRRCSAGLLEVLLSSFPFFLSSSFSFASTQLQSLFYYPISKEEEEKKGFTFFLFVFCILLFFLLPQFKLSVLDLHLHFFVIMFYFCTFLP